MNTKRRWILSLNLRLYLVILALGLIGGYFLGVTSVWFSITVASMAVFALFMTVFFIPQSCRAYQVKIQEGFILLKRGILSKRESRMKLCSIECVLTLSTPVMRVFGIHTLYLFSSGTSIRIPGLDGDSLIEVKERILRGMEGSCE